MVSILDAVILEMLVLITVILKVVTHSLINRMCLTPTPFF